MKFKDFLSLYEKNDLFIKVVEAIELDAKSLVHIRKTETKYFVEPTEELYSIIASNKLFIELDNKLNIINSGCGCLRFYKNKECLHVASLYACALAVINRELYDKSISDFKNKVILDAHSKLINRLSNDLKVQNEYFGLVHLIPVIEEENDSFYLSLKIGYDKDYVVKDIIEFINMMENNIYYSYGQKLEFTHSYECLDDVSKEFYAFIRNIATEDSIKSIKIKKSHLLKVLEFYKESYVYFKTNDEPKAIYRNVNLTTDVKLILDEEYLSIEANGLKALVAGVNNAYFIGPDSICYCHYENRMEGKIYNALFKVNGSLIVDSNSKEFISGLLPLIKPMLTVKDEFYTKYPIPQIKINSYFTYEDGIISLNPKLACSEENRNSPYLKELLDNYFKSVESYHFIKKKTKGYYLDTLDLQYKFLTSDLGALKSYGEIFFDESIKGIKTKKSTRTSVRINYNVGLLDFQFNNTELTPEELEAMLKAYHEKKKYIRLKDNSILEIDEKSAKEISDFLEDFNIKATELSKPVKKPLNYLLKLVYAKDKNLSTDEKVADMIYSIQNYNKKKVIPNPPFDNHLRGYQVEAFKWLKTLSGYGFGGILADDMGLGKTLEIISFIDSDQVDKPSIIVCPMSLVYNWENECKKWGLSIDAKPILGSIEDRESLINNIDANKKVLYITSYDSLRRDIELYKGHKFRFVIADEAQFIKNQYALKSEAIRSLESEINFALTGTPIENGLADLWSIFDFLMPGYLSSYNHFKSRYESLIIHDDDEALDNLKKRVTPFILRRTKSDVLKDLPDKIEEYYYCKMSSKQAEIYDSYVEKLKDDIKSGGDNILALITRLRQICITPELLFNEHFDNTKIDMACDLIKSSIDAGHRILLFSQFSQSFPIISQQLEKMGIRHFILDGQTKAKSRIEMVDEFNSNTDIKVFIISLKSGGTGLNLTGADMVIHIDPWWNGSAEVQATDRAYRIGQTKNVYVLKLICKDTIEEKVIKLQALKRELAEAVVESNTDKKIKLSKDEILELLD